MCQVQTGQDCHATRSATHTERLKEEMPRGEREVRQTDTPSNIKVRGMRDMGVSKEAILDN